MSNRIRRNFLQPFGAIMLLLIVGCLAVLPGMATASAVQGIQAEAPPVELVTVCGSASMVVLAAGKTVAGKQKEDTDDPLALNSMPWDQLEQEHQRLLTVTERLEGLNGENLDKLGADDAKTYNDAVTRLEAVNVAKTNHPRGAFQRKKNVGLVLNAQQLSSLQIHHRIDDDPACGYAHDKSGELEFLREPGD